MKQQSLFKTHWKHRHQHGGTLRKLRRGRTARPLSTRDPLHLVFKSNFKILRRLVTYTRVHAQIKRYARKFYIKIEQVAVESDHIHFLIRSSRRSNYQAFFRVLAGQIAQNTVTVAHFMHHRRGNEQPRRKQWQPRKKRWARVRLWKHRPFSRVVRGWRNYLTVRNYIKLNEQEALGTVPYQKKRLKGLSPEQIQSLWA